jgi:hypothetical protein
MRGSAAICRAGEFASVRESKGTENEAGRGRGPVDWGHPEALIMGIPVFAQYSARDLRERRCCRSASDGEVPFSAVAHRDAFDRFDL